ncbi:MAG: hypothetical protein C0594_01570 [Marinilabiliales bacterium]|nr:MAG: hypothetical protein C0594_01570 [Marinilabiliales bacterium]
MLVPRLLDRSTESFPVKLILFAKSSSSNVTLAPVSNIRLTGSELFILVFTSIQLSSKIKGISSIKPLSSGMSFPGGFIKNRENNMVSSALIITRN